MELSGCVFMSSNRFRLTELDAIRGLAALVVVLYHYTYRFYEIYPALGKAQTSFYYGSYGVQLFFVVSGFVIFMSLQRVNSSKDFIFSRFIRLYPAYWLSLCITFLVVSCFGLEGREVDVGTFALNFLMFHSQFRIANVDGVYWTLLYELKFYFWMLILYRLNLLKIIEAILICCLLIKVILFFLVDNSQIVKVFNELFILKYLSFFSAGICFYKLYRKNENINTYVLLALSLFVSIYFDTKGGEVVVLAIFIIFTLLSFNRLQFIAVKPLSYLGVISYALYLVHQNVGYVFIGWGLKNGFNVYMVTLLSLILSLALATLITYKFDNVLGNKLKKIYRNYNERN